MPSLRQTRPRRRPHEGGGVQQPGGAPLGLRRRAAIRASRSLAGGGRGRGRLRRGRSRCKTRTCWGMPAALVVFVHACGSLLIAILGPCRDIQIPVYRPDAIDSLGPGHTAAVQDKVCMSRLCVCYSYSWPGPAGLRVALSIS
jgi:hypothetical protein